MNNSYQERLISQVVPGVSIIGSIGEEIKVFGEISSLVTIETQIELDGQRKVTDWLKANPSVGVLNNGDGTQRYYVYPTDGQYREVALLSDITEITEDRERLIIKSIKNSVVELNFLNTKYGYTQKWTYDRYGEVLKQDGDICTCTPQDALDRLILELDVYGSIRIVWAKQVGALIENNNQ